MGMLAFGIEDSNIAGLGNVSVDTTAGRFNANVACGLAVPVPAVAPAADYWRSIGQFSSSSFYLRADVWSSAVAGNTTNVRNSSFLLRLIDAAGVPRIVIAYQDHWGVTNNPNIQGPWIVQTVDAAGTYTTIGAAGGFIGPPVSTLSNIVVQVKYGVDGFVVVYIDNTAVFNFGGDVTTDGVTALAGYDLGQPCLANTLGVSGTTVWSSDTVTDFDPRSLLPVKLPITGAGATSAWNGDASGATVDEITLNDTDGIDGATAGQVELFTQGVTLPVGTYIVAGVGLSARAAAAAGVTPQHLDFLLRIGGVNYPSPPLAPAAVLGRSAYTWATSPATGVAFTNAEVAGLQIGVKSAA